MKIVDVKAIPIAVRLEKPLIWATGETYERNTTLIQVVTDEDIIGLGEAAGPPKVICAITEMLKKRVLNRDPLDIETLWRDMFGRRSGQFADMIITAISGVDIALWDIMGKKTKLPVSRLLGGISRDKVKAYATGGYFKPVEDLVKEVSEYMKQGFQAAKIKVGFGVNKDVERVKAVRESIGYSVELMVDATEAYEAATAIELARKIGKYEIGWFEEPVSSRDVESLGEVSSKTDIPIAAGEYEHTRFGFRDMITQRAVHIIQPDATIAGGLTECKKIAAMAETWRLKCAPHVWGSAIGLAAHLHLVASTPNCHFFEFDRTPNPLRESLAKDPIRFENGYIEVPKKPGLGVDMDLEALKKYSDFALKEAGLYNVMNP